MKRKLKILGMLIAALIVFVGAVSVSEKSVTGGTMFDTFRRTEQIASALSTDETAIFTEQKLESIDWTISVINTGSNTLATPEIVAYLDTTYTVDLVTNATALGINSTGCAANIASGEKCILTNSKNLFQGIAVNATALTTNETSVKTILHEKIR